MPPTPAGSTISDSNINTQLLVDTTNLNTAPIKAPVNLCFDHAKASSEKKRKREVLKVTSMASKKQKTHVEGLTIPDNGNSMKCVLQ
jgi:hypothetical protein